MQSRCCWPPERLSALSFSRSLTSSQSAACRSARSTRSSRFVLPAEHARAEGDVVVDRLRERVRLLEDHADPLAHLDRVDVGAVEVLAVVEDRALDRGARDQVVHAVEAADERALAAAGRADERRDVVLVDLERDVLERRDARRRRRVRSLDVEDDVSALGLGLACALGEQLRVHAGDLRQVRQSRFPSSASPPSLVAVAEPDRERVQRQQDHEQDDDRRRGEQPGTPPAGGAIHW